METTKAVKKLLLNKGMAGEAPVCWSTYTTRERERERDRERERERDREREREGF